jgi:hypothetical protein
VVGYKWDVWRILATYCTLNNIFFFLLRMRHFLSHRGGKNKSIWKFKKWSPATGGIIHGSFWNLNLKKKRNKEGQFLWKLIIVILPFFNFVVLKNKFEKKLGGISKHSHTLTHIVIFWWGGGGRGDRWKVHNAAKLIDKNENTVQKKIDGQF